MIQLIPALRRIVFLRVPTALIPARAAPRPTGHFRPNIAITPATRRLPFLLQPEFVRFQRGGRSSRELVGPKGNARYLPIWFSTVKRT